MDIHIKNNALTNPVAIEAIATQIKAMRGLPDTARLTPRQAAEFLTAHGIPTAVTTLAKWRCTRSDHLEYLKLGGRIVYEVAALRRFAAVT